MQKIFLTLRIVFVLAAVVGLAGFETTATYATSAKAKVSKKECKQQKEVRDKEQAEALKAALSEPVGGPLPENWQQLVKDAISETLKDPYSAQFRFNKEPAEGLNLFAPSLQEFMADNFFAGCKKIGVEIPVKTTWTKCWNVDVEVNAKNEFGAYTGYTEYRVSIKDGKVLKFDQSVDQVLKTLRQ